MHENAALYEQLNVPIIIIVGQKRNAVEKWLKENPMPFPFLIDEKREVIKAFDIYHLIGKDALNIAHPSTFLISAEGTIEFAYVGENQGDRPTNETTHAEVMKVLDATFTD